MALRREIMSYLGAGAIGGIVGYYTGAQELLGIQSQETVRPVPQEEQPPENQDQPTEEEQSTTPPQSVGGDAAAYYTFEGSGTELIDRSENSHTGRLNNAQRVSGRTGDGLSFELSQQTYSVLGSPGELTPGSDSFTVSLHFQTTNTRTGGGSNKQRVLAIRGSTNERVVFTLLGEEPRAAASLSEGGYDPDDLRQDSNAMIADGEWHHLVLQRDMDDRQIRFYVDDEKVDQTEVTQVNIDPDAPVYLGGQPEYPNPRHYTGKIDRVGIYSQALTPAELP